MSQIRRQVCVGCSVEKPHTLRNFYRCRTGKYGLRIKCKECVKAEVYENRAIKADYYNAYYQRRNRDPNRRAAIKAWRQTPKGRASQRLSNRIYSAFRAAEIGA